MAFLDDPDFLISHIRNSCVTSDDTGMCEMVIVNEEAENNKVKARRKIVGFPNTPVTASSVAFSLAQSFDIAVSPEINLKPIGKILGKAKKGSDEQAKVKNIVWKERQESVTSDDIEDAFNKRSFKNKQHPSSSSQLSKQIKESIGEPNNPYLDYARFDGEAYQGTCPTKKLRIFLTMLNEDDAIIPMFVTVLGTAHVQDLIGLIMFKYTAEDLSPALKGTTERYCLRIAEDDGEVDTDFPALDKDELITKFGFTCLALVENEPKTTSKQAVTPATSNSVIVKVNDTRHGFSHVKLDSRKAKMKVVYDKMLKKRGLRRTGHEYVLEKQSEPGIPIDLEAPLDSMGTTEFVLTRGGRKQNPSEKDSGEVKFDFTSFQYKSYRLQMLHKLRQVTEIQLGVSVEGIEIDPVSAPRTTKLWPVKQKPVSHEMENIADCEVTDWKNGGRTAFRIWYYSNSSHEFKHHDFEADNAIADEIVMKLKHIFKSTTVSKKRRDFLSAKEKKSVRRKTNR